MAEPARRLAPAAAPGGPRGPRRGGGHKSRLKKVICTEDEIQAVLACIDGPQRLRDRALIRALYNLAMRRSEAADLTWEGIDFERETAWFWRRKTKDFNGVAMHPNLVADLKALRGPRRPEGHVFLGQRGPLTPNGIWRIWRRWAGRAGLAPAKWHVHILRRSRATHLIEEGEDVTKVRRIMGHADLRVTDEYISLAESDVDAAAREHGI